MRDISIAEGQRAIQFAQEDRHVRLNKRAEPGDPEREDITELEAIAIARENPDLIFAAIPQPLAENSWTEPLGNDPDFFTEWNADWKTILTDHFTIIFKGCTPNVYQLKDNQVALIESRIDPKQGNNAEQLQRGLAWSEKTREPSAAAGLTLSGWIASRIQAAMHA